MRKWIKISAFKGLFSSFPSFEAFIFTRVSSDILILLVRNLVAIDEAPTMFVIVSDRS